MELFEKVEPELYSWTMFYLLSDVCYNAEDCKMVREDLGKGAFIEREVTTGIGLNMAEEKKRFNACKGLSVFTKEVELVILCPDRETNLYTSSKKEKTETNQIKQADVIINSIDVVGSYVYISPKEICSPVYLKNGTPFEDTYFPVFKAYVLTKHAAVEDFAFDFTEGEDVLENEFTIRYTNPEDEKQRTILRIKGVTIDITYSFVFYVLKSLRKNKQGFETHLRVEKVRRREYR